MATMTAPTGTGYTQTPEEQAREAGLWRALRAYIAEKRVLRGWTFELHGRIVELKGDKDNPGQPRRIPNTYPGAKTAERLVLLAVAEVTEPGLHGLEFVRNIGFTFFDGGANGGNKGGMYLLHQAVLQEEPPRELIDGGGSFDPDIYCKRPVLLSLKYNGDTAPGTPYYGKRDNLDVGLAGFKPDPEAFIETMPSGSVVTTSGLPQAAPQQEPMKIGDGTDQRATERQVKFIYAIAREAGMDENAVNDWSLELYSQEVDQLNRRDAATLIEALQRKRNDLPSASPVAAPTRPAPPARPLPPTVAAGPPTITDDQMQRVRDHFKAEGWGEGAEIAAWCAANYDGRGLAQIKAEEWDGLVETLGMAPF